MGEHQTTFKVREIESTREGLFVALPSSLQIIPGMMVWNSTLEEETRRFVVVDVIRPPDRDPAIHLPWAQGDDFRVGDLVVVDPGRTAEGDLLLQSSTPTWFLRGRGVVVGGMSQGTIAKGDQLVLCTEGGRHLSCRCEFIERFDDSSGKPTHEGEGVGILLSVDCEEAHEALRTGNGEILLRIVSAFPSLHSPSNRLERISQGRARYASESKAPMTVEDSGIHTETQDTECDAWYQLLDLIDRAAASGATKFVPGLDLGWDSYSKIVTLPPSIAKLKSVRQLGLYGSNLDRIPPEIAEMESLEFFDVYTSYRLHWFPYEITRCPNLKYSRISTRALFGNYKYRNPFPRLDDNFDSLPLVTPTECSVCRTPLGSQVARRWISLNIATDVVPLLVNACSMNCIDSLPDPPENYVSVPHSGGSHIEQPPRYF